MTGRARQRDIKKKRKDKAFWGKLLAIFFAVMSLCTVASRAADSVIIPRVRAEKPSPGNLNYKVEGKGSIKASEGELVTVPAGLRVKEVTKPGTNVEAGAGLAVIDLDELAKALEEEKAKLEKLRLQVQREQINGTPDEAAPQTLSAGKNLEMAQNNYNEAAAKLEEAAEAEKNEADGRLKKAEEDKKAAYDTWQMLGGESNAEAKAAYDQAILSIDQEAERIGAEKQAKTEALEQNRDAMQDALNQAQAAYEIALTEDENIRANRQKAREGSDITVKGLEIDLRQQEKAVDRLQEVMDAKGIIKSPVKGTVTGNTLSEGLVTSGQDYIRIGTGGYEFMAPVDKDNASKLKTGDTISVEFSDIKGKKKLKITDIRSESDKSGGNGGSNGGGSNSGGDHSTSSPDPSAQPYGGNQEAGAILYICAKADGDEYSDGMEGSFAIEKESDIRYDWILPIEAVREDQNGPYCLVSRKKNTILGEEYVAERVRLVKKAKDVNKAAVEGALTDETKVIIESSKEIKEGDRFRIEEKD